MSTLNPKAGGSSELTTPLLSARVANPSTVPPPPPQVGSVTQASAATQVGAVAQASAATQANAATQKPVFRFPHEKTMMHAVKLSISEDKPIMMDYWVNSLQKTALIGVREENNERMLVKSEDEYTSPIAKFYKSATEYIVVTENSIYIVSSEIVSRKIS